MRFDRTDVQLATLSHHLFLMERETRFELATPTLARLCSTTELFPQHKQIMRPHKTEDGVP